MKKIILSITGMFILFGFSLTTAAQNTAGTLMFTLTCPKHSSGNYETDGRYAVAIWIESCTPCGTTAGTSTFVKTKARYWGSNTMDHLPTWVSKSGSSVVDAATGATMGRGGTGTPNSLANAFAPHTYTWNGTNVAGAVVADGSYRVVVQETWGHGGASATRYFPFTKGVSADSQTPAADTNFTAISLSWAATLGLENFDSSPAFVVYPNPSKGVFNIDFKNEVKNIKVVNILGEVVYSEDIDSSLTDTTKKIDISSLVNGIYIFSLTNDKGTSTYKVLLDK
jgi:hypothetical protein